MRVVFDIETNALENPDRLWCIVALDIDNPEHIPYIFNEPDVDPEEFLSFAGGVDLWVGHNILGYDVLHLNRLVKQTVVDPGLCVDTLVVSRLLDFSIDGGHSLRAWGDRLGCPKVEFSEFSRWSQELVNYCVQDVRTNLVLYNHLLPYINSPVWSSSLRVEHELAQTCVEMHTNGFPFDKEEALRMQEEIGSLLKVLDDELLTAFQPIPVCIGTVTPKLTKHGTLSRSDFRWEQSGDLTPYTAGAPFSRIDYVPFNPGSPKQIVDRLNRAGWKPTERTKGHTAALRELGRGIHGSDLSRLDNFKRYGWTISEENLATLPKDAPEAARKLVQRLLLASRYRTLTEWITVCKGSPGDWKVHGNFNHIGAWTHRMSHSDPNMGNIAKAEGAPKGREPTEVEQLKMTYGNRMRQLWTSGGDDYYLIGVDADGIQLRILAHYMDDPEFIEALVNGKKENGTDPHTRNMHALGSVCKNRDIAKRYIYAYLLGAGIGKQAEILECKLGQAKLANNQFERSLPGLTRLKSGQIPFDYNRGFFEGLDGRFVNLNDVPEYKVLSGYLQNGESVVMRHALSLWRNQLAVEKLPYRIVNFVHDEWQTRTIRDMEIAKRIATIQADSIRIAGEQLGVKCPLAGSVIGAHGQLAIGNNWLETH